MVIRGWRRVPAVLLLTLVMTGNAAASSTYTVPAGGSLQAVLDAAPAGSLVLLEPGATYTGPFVIRRAVTIRTSGDLPAARVTPAWSGTLAILVSPTNEPALRLAASVRQVRLVGLEIAPNGSPAGTSIEIGSNGETDESRQPEDVLLDRLLVRGHPVNGQKRGLSLHGSHITVTRSHVSDFKAKGQDTQAIWINNGWGPYHIEDNYLEASGENIMAGGDTPRIAQLVPADITIVHNTMAKPLSWKTEGWTVKNLLELKSGRRVVIRDNVLEGNWVSGQTGYAVQITPRNQYGSAPWTVVEDVLFERNIVRQSGSGINLLGDDDEQPSRRTQRITIRNNLLILDSRAHGGPGRCLMLGRAPQYVEFSQNTCIADGAAPFYTYRGGSVQVILGGVFRRNVFLHNEYGFSGDTATAGGVVALASQYPDLVFVDNLIGGGLPSRYPGNFVVDVDEFRAQFVDYARGDFRLTAASRKKYQASDGGLLGADLEGVAAPLPPASPAPPPTSAPDPGASASPVAPDVTTRSAVQRTGSSTHAAPPARGAAPPPGLDRTALVRDDVPAGAAPVAPRTSGQTTPAPASLAAPAYAVAAGAAPGPAPAAPPIATSAIDTAPLSALAGDGAAPAPSISLTMSGPADAVPAHATVTLATRAANLPAPLARVDVYIDRVPLGHAVRAPFEIEWRVPAPGTYRLTAVAVGSDGAVFTSPALDVTVR